MYFKKISLVGSFLLILVFCMGFSFAEYDITDFHEMNGVILAKEVSGESIDYLIDINGTYCYLSCSNQPYEEFNVGDNVTMNGTIDSDNVESIHVSSINSAENCDFGGEYEGDFPHIELGSVVVNQHTYGQMRLTDDVDNEYYKQIDEYN